MRILHSYWTQGKEHRDSCGGWLSEEANMMCWALSCLNAKKYYNHVELYTDKVGYHTLIKRMKLPYDKVHLVYNSDSLVANFPYYLWAMPKIYTYSLQDEPFIHIDGDFILWEKKDFNHPIIYQNEEKNVPLYESIYRSFKKEYINKQEDFSQCIYSDFVSEAANMGIFGGRDLEFIRKYSSNVLDFVKHQHLVSSTFHNNHKDINCFLEQYYLLYLCREQGEKTHTIHTPANLNDKKALAECIYNYPGKHAGFNHFLGSSKKQELMVDYVKNELYSTYPEYYNLIHDEFKASDTKDIYFNLSNKKLNIEKQYSDLMQKLKESNIIFNADIASEYRDFLDYKKACFNFIPKNNSSFSRLADEQFKYIDYSTKIKLNDCFVACKIFSIPWEELAKAEKITKSPCPRVVTKEELHTSRPYAVFMLTPFEHSVYTVFMDEVCAYILQNILRKDYLSISEIAEKINFLLKDKVKNINKTLEFTMKVVRIFNMYGILTFKGL